MTRLRMHTRLQLHGLLPSLLAILLAACTPTAAEPAHEPPSQRSLAAAVPSGFVDELVASGFTGPTAFSIAPDGRIFVAQQDGHVRVVKDGVLLAAPFASLSVDASGEGGLLGITVDPAFPSTPYVYVFYTVTTPTRHNRITRLSAVGDVVQAGSEITLFDLDDVGDCLLHFGGALHFAPDGHLFVGVGDSCDPDGAQSLTRTNGKLLRLHADGSIPTDNPFFASTTGRHRAIWARGLRNPYTFAISRAGRIFINDVGGGDWEEVNEGAAGANYGWPLSEGATSIPGQTSPVYAYPHSNPWPTGCAITGGAFYDPPTPQYPASYLGKYFYADYCKSYIRTLDTSSFVSSEFSDQVAEAVDLAVGPDAMLYRLERTTSAIYRIRYAAQGQAPTILAAPNNRSVAAGQTVTFSVSASGSQPLAYQWQRNGANIVGANLASLSLTAALADDGAQFRVVVSNALGTVTSAAATLTVVQSAAPVATISSPAAGTLYSGGDTISFAGSGSDAEDGVLPPSALTWEVAFHHDAHTHPFLAPTSGQSTGTFVIPRVGHTETNVFYRIHLRVRDSSGLESSTFRDIAPRLSTLTLQTNPPGLTVSLDGSPVATPATVTSVVGVTRTLGAPSPQLLSGTSFSFSSWSDGGPASHSVDTPATATSYVATFTQACETTLGPISASASSSEAADLSASRAIDGDATTRWSSAFSDPQWIAVNLGTPQNIAGVVLHWEAAFGRDYQIQVGDGSNWNTIFTRTGFGGGTDTITGLAGHGSHVRVYITGRGTSWGNSLWELTVLGASGPACGAVCGNGVIEAGESCDDGNRTAGDGCNAVCVVESGECRQQLLPLSNALASSVESGDLLAPLAIDGSPSTRWSSAFGDPQWISVDLGAPRHVSRVLLQWEAAHARDYRIEVADTPTGPWRTLYTRSGFAGGNDDIGSLSGTGRYLRVYATARATSWGNSLWELGVYGDPDPDC